MIVQLSQAYPSRYGIPVLTEVDTGIFTLSYFADCMNCTFCHDACCSEGTDVTAVDLQNIAPRTQELERHVGQPREQWFTGEIDTAPDWPGGTATRTQVLDGHCVFLNTSGRGCLIHQFAIENTIDVHEIKPMVCMLWPVTWQDGLLRPSNEVRDNEIICVGPGRTCYRNARKDIEYYFGAELLAELDALEQKTLAPASPMTVSRTSLPLSMVPPEK